MILRYLLPIIAVIGAAFAVYTVFAQAKPQPQAKAVAEPASSPYQSQVPGAGLVEPSTEFISIGTNVPGIVTKVFVKAGDQVKAGDPLFMIDDRTLRAELASREAAIATAQANLDKLRAMPRQEEIPPAEAKLLEAQSQLEDQSAQLAMWESASSTQGAVSADELSRKRFAVQTARTRVTQARSELDLLKAGAWRPDIAVAEASLATAKADANRTRTELDRLTVRAPVNAEILKVNIRTGEYATASPQGGGAAAGGGSGTQGADNALMIIGDTETLHLRVDIDENDAWRVKEGAKGTAFIRGNSKYHTPITFVRFEPYVIPKKSLTGASGERVDTRVLQVICAFKRSDLNAPVYVGQQMDVFLEGPPLGDATFGASPEQAAKDPAKKK